MKGLSASPAVLTTSSADATWGWFGVEVTAAVDMTKSREYQSLEESKRVQKAVERQRLWLSQLWSVTPAGAVEFRWYCSGDGAVSLALLGRVSAASEVELQSRAQAAVSLLVDSPSHVETRVVEDDQELLGLLRPFDVHQNGAGDIRKRCVTATPSRPDAGVEYYFAFAPFGGSASDWPRLIESLGSARHPTCISVALRPTQATPEEVNLLLGIASSYRRLGERGQPSGVGIYKKLKEIGPDAFAVDAQHLYQDAARRLQGYGFEMRVSVASAGPLDPGLLTTTAEVVGGSERTGTDSQTSSASKEFRGTAASISIPIAPDDWQRFKRNFESIGFDEWGPHEVWSRPASPPTALQHLVRMVDLDQAASGAYLPIAANGVLQRFPVTAPTFNVATTHEASGPSVRLGTQVVGGHDSGPIEIELESLRTHAFFAGTTGAGKSTAVLTLMSQLWQNHRLPFLVLEPVNTIRNDYRQLLKSEGFEDLLVLTAGADHIAPFRLNPFEVPPKVTVGEHIANILGAFDAAFGLFDPLPAIYREALSSVYSEAGIATSFEGGDREDWPTLRDFEAQLATVVERQQYAGEVQSNIEAASLVRIRQLANGPAASVFDCRRSTPIDKLLERPTVLELGHLGSLNEKEQNLVVGMVLVCMAEQLVSMDRPDGLNHLTVLEEAHRFLRKPEPSTEGKGDPSAAAASLFGNLLAEVRKHGEGFAVVDQDPDKLIPDTYKNTNLKVMFRLQSEEDRRRVGSAMGFDEDHVKAAGTLEPFMGFAHVAGMDRPAHIRSAATDYLNSGHLGDLATNDEVANRYRSVLQDQPDLQRGLAPYRACEGCASVCEHRAVATMAAARSASRSRFTELIDQMPAGEEASWEDWSAKVDNELGEVLVDLGHAASSDARACLFLHSARKEWSASIDVTQLVLDHRANLSSLAGETE